MTKLKIIIISIVVIIAIATSFYFYKITTSKKSLKIINNATTTEIDFVDLLKNHRKTYNDIRLSMIAKTVDECLLISTSSALNCIQRLAIADKNLDYCNRISSDLIVQCKNYVSAELAILSNKPEDCLALNSQNKITCIKTYSSNFQIASECDIFQQDKQICLDILSHAQIILNNSITSSSSCAVIDNSDIQLDCKLIIANKPRDSDSDGIEDTVELTYHSDPFKKDTDSDGLSDFDEIKIHQTSPARKDTDSDGLTDNNELLIGTDPVITDTDKDGFIDGDEAIKSYNPCGPGQLTDMEQLKKDCSLLKMQP